MVAISQSYSAVLPDQNLFPFGLSEGDLIVPPALDGTTPRIELCTAFPFFGIPETALHVSSVLHKFRRARMNHLLAETVNANSVNSFCAALHTRIHLELAVIIYS